MFNAVRGEHGPFRPERHLPDLLETLPDELLVIDDHATILYANAAAITSVGATKEELLGGTLWQWFPTWSRWNSTRPWSKCSMHANLSR